MATSNGDLWRELIANFTCAHEPWMAKAACRGKPLSLFFPGRGQSKRKAFKICGSCSVKKECSDYAKRTETQHGIWGGEILRRNGNGATLDVPDRRPAKL